LTPFTALELERARAETRGCRERIHFNNAGAALPPIPVADALYGYLGREEFEGGYEVMEAEAAALEHFYAVSARLLHCSPEEIAFTDSATRAWMSVFYAFNFQPGDRVLVGSSEYGSNLVSLLQQVKRCGIEMVLVPDDEQGEIDCRALEKLIDRQTRLICLTHVPSGEGLVNPAERVGRIARAAGVPYLLDACQSLGQLPVEVDAIGCDLLCGTGRKFLRAPRGTGLLYVRKSLLERLEPPQLNHFSAQLLSPKSYVLRADARRFECWERSYAGQLALGVAIDYALTWGLDRIEARVSALAEGLRRKLAEINGVTVCDRGRRRSGIVTFFMEQYPAVELKKKLAAHRLNASVVSLAANPISSSARGLPDLLRISPHYYNTEEECDRCLMLLQEFAGN